MIAKDFQVQQLALFKANASHYRAYSDILPESYNLKDKYVILGEVEKINHYLVLNISRGELLTGAWHLSDFERISEEDI